MTRRIVEIVDSLEPGGPQNQLIHLAAGLPRDEFDVHICSLTPGPLARQLQARQISHCVFGRSRKFEPLRFWQLRQRLARLKADVVHTWTRSAHLFGRAAALSAGVKGIVATRRVDDCGTSAAESLVTRYLDARSQAIVVDTHEAAQSLADSGIPPGKVRVIARGAAAAAPGSCSRDKLLAELGLPSSARLVATAGHLEQRKRIKDLIWATDLLKVIRDDVHLLVIGDGPLRSSLERYRHLCHVDEKVHFLGPREDCAALVKQVDVVWVASSSQGASSAILEAMAAGVPVVASHIPANAELVIEGETGYLVPVGDRAGYARLANKILDDPALARQLGAKAQQRANSEFSIQSMVERHAALYRGIGGQWPVASG